MSADPFAHLHVHSHYSVLDGHGKPGAYAGKAAELGQPALAITDHGSIGGAYQHYKECKNVGIKPIIGIEAYIAPTSRLDRTSSSGFSGQGRYGHITLLATGSRGLRNLFKLQADAFTTGFYQKPRIDLESLAAHSEGLIVTTGCAAGHVATYLRADRPKVHAAYQFARDLKDIFQENLFVEIMDHGIDEPDLNDAELNRKLIELAERENIPLVATNDAHYCNPEDHDVQQALLCVSTRDVLSNPSRFKFNGTGFHLKNYDEMSHLGLPEKSLANTLVIADRVESYDEVFAHTLRMPRYSDDEGWDLDCAAHDGLHGRFDGELIPDVYVQRLDYELEVINSMGYPGYFLVEAKILKRARNEGIRIGPGRGSAGGSLVAYSLGITDLDPIAHGLLFERFLNPSRVSLPDIDIDVAEHQRPRFLELVAEEYGYDRVAIIGTYGTIAAKAALKDANRVMGGAYRDGEAYVSKVPPPKFGRSPSLDEYRGPEDEVVRLARRLEGTIRQKGQHAAGVIISPEPLEDLIPLWHPANQKIWVTENDMHELEALGFTKMDYLGLRNLGIIDDCLLRLRSDVDVPLPYLPEECNDPKTYELLASGNTLGVFQLDSPGMRGLLRLLRPNCFDDISAVLALYRPGPMGANSHTEFAHRKNKNGGRWSSQWAIHPELEEDLRPVLESTYGLIVFQEQVLAALNVVCGWSYAEAGLLFDAMRKKNHEKMAESKPSYMSNGRSKGYSSDALEALWETLVPFADYSFNRAHTAGYGLVAYWTAYLKANHPNEYMSALLSSVSDDPDRLHEYLQECERIGVKLLPPDINESGEGFTPTKEGVRYGLAAIRGVGEKAFQGIGRRRPYLSLGDFFNHVPSNCLNIGVVGALSKSGSLDGVCSSREALVDSVERLVTLAQATRKADPTQPLLVEPTYSVRRASISDGPKSRLYQGWEKDTLGVSLTRGNITIYASRTLQEADIRYIFRVIQSHPGNSLVTLDFGLTTLTGCATMSLTEKAREEFEALGKIKVEEN